MHDQRLKGTQLHIRHALNGGEVKIPRTNTRTDGYAEQFYQSESTGSTEKKIFTISMAVSWLLYVFPSQR